MKKRIWIPLVALLVVAAAVAAGALVHAGAFCDHRWQEANCTAGEICTLCGRTQGTPLGHFWQNADCENPDTCTRCGLTQGEPFCHIWKEADCTQPETCSRCYAAQGTALGHIWQAATCLTPEICTRCGELQEAARGHSWQEAGCLTPKTCISCGLTEGEPLGHTWVDATCAAPRTCTGCGLTEGDPLVHTWQEATCLAPKTCASCNLTEGETVAHHWLSVTCTRPETCRFCGLTQGSPLGHIWQDATCTSARRCSRCGGTEGTPLGHVFADSTNGTKLCRTCGRSVDTKYVAITFDDGPSGSITDTLLAGLQQRGVKATFFICGYRIRSFPHQPQKILDYGHEIGLHTDNHATLSRLDAAGIRRELEGMMSLLPAGYTPRLMRPPGGAHNATVRQVCGEMGLSVVMWSVDPRDWETNNVNTIVNKVVNGARDGSIILMHDLKSSSVRAALAAIDRLKAMGYEFVTVSDLAAIKGQQLRPGEVCYSFTG